jgi:ubiquinone/menaquinone biosynthesis C-methylase UbiE
MDIKESSNQGADPNNIRRFDGFGSIYNDNRPSPPAEVAAILTEYRGARPQRIVDVGSGTGLSTFLWSGQADEIFGIEPNADMRAVAAGKLRKLQEQDRMEGSRISFLDALSHKIPLEDGSVDIMTCSQSFHWMDPVLTLREASRLLISGGVFAAYDCDWPASGPDWEVEEAYLRLLNETDKRLAAIQPEDKRAEKRDKNSHLRRLEESGLFRYTREVVFQNKESCDAERYIGLAMSQGGLQTLLKLDPAQLEELFEPFQRTVRNSFASRTLQLRFSYRMRLGIK